MFESEEVNYKKECTRMCMLLPGLTIAVTVASAILYFLIPSFWFLFSPLVLIAALFLLAKKRSSVKNFNDTVIPIYEIPDKLSPVEAGILIDQKLHDRDISAQLIHYARKGILDIRLENGQYVLELNQDVESLQQDFDRMLLESIFRNKKSVKFREVKENTMGNVIKYNDFTINISKKLIEKGYYNKSFRMQKGDYNAYGLCVIVAAGIMYLFSVYATIGLFICGVVIILAGRRMPIKAKKGLLIQRKILGFKDYIDVAEKDRVKFHSDPAKNPENFQKFLPFAMAFGLEKKWAHKIRESNTKVESDIPWFNSSNKTYNIEEQAEEIGNINSSSN